MEMLRIVTVSNYRHLDVTVLLQELKMKLKDNKGNILIARKFLSIKLLPF